MGLFESVRRPAKTTQQYLPWRLHFPSHAPPRKKINNLPKNASPSNLPSPVYLSRHRSHRQAPIHKSNVSDYCKGFIPRTSERPRVDTIKNTHLKPSCHRTGTTSVELPKPECDLRHQRILPPPQEPDPTRRARANIPPPNATRSRARATLSLLPSTDVRKNALKHFSQEPLNGCYDDKVVFIDLKTGIVVVVLSA